MIEHLAYIGLGSNLCDPIRQVERALRTLNTLPKTKLETHSSLYQTAPLGPKNQPDYINAVAILKTQLTPSTLLRYLHAIEKKQGRIRTIQRWGPRTLDLDILLYDKVQSKNPVLSLPHPELEKRTFVLLPLFECVPNLVLPNGKKLDELVAQSSTGGLKKLKTPSLKVVLSQMPAC